VDLRDDYGCGRAVSLAALGGQSRSMPARKLQPTPARVVEEHLAAFNACDWNRLMAQFPDNVEFFSPRGPRGRPWRDVRESG
jgi:hypothetical protein